MRRLSLSGGVGVYCTIGACVKERMRNQFQRRLRLENWHIGLFISMQRIPTNAMLKNQYLDSPMLRDLVPE